MVQAESKLRKAGQEISVEKDLAMGVGPEQKKVIQEGSDFIEEFAKQAEQGWKRDQGAPMAMRGGESRAAHARGKEQPDRHWHSGAGQPVRSRPALRSRVAQGDD